jgi:hypothetical protein
MAGLLQGAHAMAATAQLGEGLELDVTAAAVVGGTPLTGSVGSIQGTILGASIVTTLSNRTSSIELDPYFQNIVKGFSSCPFRARRHRPQKIGIIRYLVRRKSALAPPCFLSRVRMRRPGWIGAALHRLKAGRPGIKKCRR